MQMSKKSMRRGSAYLKLVHVLEQDEALSDTGRKKISWEEEVALFLELTKEIITVVETRAFSVKYFWNHVQR